MVDSEHYLSIKRSQLAQMLDKIEEHERRARQQEWERKVASTRPCPNPACVDGSVHFNKSLSRDPQYDDLEPCHVCGGFGGVPR